MRRDAGPAYAHLGRQPGVTGTPRGASKSRWRTPLEITVYAGWRQLDDAMVKRNVADVRTTGLSLFMLKAVLSGRVDELIDLARINLFR